MYALKQIMATHFETETEWSQFLDILREVFPISVSQQSNDAYSSTKSGVSSAVNEVFKEDHMESNKTLFTRVKTIIVYSL